MRDVLLFPLSMPAAKAQDSPKIDQEAVEWERTLQANTVEAFMNFLERYPNGDLFRLGVVLHNRSRIL